jgi:hypothetical protein
MHFKALFLLVVVPIVASVYKPSLLPEDEDWDNKMENCKDTFDIIDEDRNLLESVDICYQSADSVFVYADEQPPSITTPGSIGWQYDRAINAAGKINWYFYLSPTLAIGPPSSLSSTNPIEYGSFQSMFAVIDFGLVPGTQGPYFALYTDPATSPNFYKSRLQWRLPATVLLTGKVLLWAGSSTPPSTLYSDLPRLQLGLLSPQGEVTTISGVQVILSTDLIQSMSIQTDSNNPGNLPRSFRVYDLGYVLADNSVSSISLSICGSPTFEPTTQPTSKPTIEPTANPTSRPPTKPPTAPKSTSKPTSKPTNKPTKKKV